MAVEEYIDNGEPISSKFLVGKYNFGLSPATIRFELQKLTEDGYLYQPHTSAGRIPTDKGYRFFIDELMAPLSLGFGEENLIKSIFEKEWDDFEMSLFNKELAKNMVEISNDLVVIGSPEDNNIYYDGVLNLFQKPELKEAKQIREGFEIIENFKNNLENVFDKFGDSLNDIRVFIGRENPFYGAENYSVIVSRIEFPCRKIKKKSKDKSEILAILGPKRMRYNKNISLLEFILQSGYDF